MSVDRRPEYQVFDVSIKKRIKVFLFLLLFCYESSCAPWVDKGGLDSIFVKLLIKLFGQLRIFNKYEETVLFNAAQTAPIGTFFPMPVFFQFVIHRW
jgi:hypothetical protein